MILQLLVFGLTIGSWMGCQEKTGVTEKLIPVGPLPAELNENSGMFELSEDTYVGLNDSGNESILYAFHLKRPGDVRSIRIRNATNVDWEELASDNEYVYIGDTGNNSGKRKDLVIYRVEKGSLKRKDEVYAEKITFSYENQTQFKSSSKNNFDCEAMVCLDDSLYLFSKNRGNQKTDLYSLPNTPGNYKARHLGQFDAGGLITSAAIRKNGNKNQLALIGYKNKGMQYSAFLIYFPQVIGSRFFESPSKRVKYNTSLQIESVIYHDPNTVYISNESNKGDKGLVYMAKLPE